MAGVDPNLNKISATETEITREIAEESGIDPLSVERVVGLVGSHYSAPIPPAAELEKLNQLTAGPGLDIVTDYLTQRLHDRQAELQAIDLAKRDANRKDGWPRYAGLGQWLGAGSLFVFLGAAIFAMLQGNTIVAVAFVSPAIVGAIAKLIEGRAQSPEDEEKHPK